MNTLAILIHSTPANPNSLTPPLQIGAKYVVDCGMEEELCSSSRVRFAVDHVGHVLSTSMEGVGSIPHSQVSTIIQVGWLVGWLVGDVYEYTLQMALQVAEEMFGSVDAAKEHMTATNTKQPIFAA